MEEPRDSGGQVSDANTGHASDASAELSELETAGPWRKAFDALRASLWIRRPRPVVETDAEFPWPRDAMAAYAQLRRTQAPPRCSLDAVVVVAALPQVERDDGAAVRSFLRDASLRAGASIVEVRGPFAHGNGSAAFVETGSNEAAQSVSRALDGFRVQEPARCTIRAAPYRLTTSVNAPPPPQRMPQVSAILRSSTVSSSDEGPPVPRRQRVETLTGALDRARGPSAPVLSQLDGDLDAAMAQGDSKRCREVEARITRAYSAMLGGLRQLCESGRDDTDVERERGALDAVERALLRGAFRSRDDDESDDEVVLLRGALKAERLRAAALAKEARAHAVRAAALTQDARERREVLQRFSRRAEDLTAITQQLQDRCDRAERRADVAERRAARARRRTGADALPLESDRALYEGRLRGELGVFRAARRRRVPAPDTSEDREEDVSDDEQFVVYRWDGDGSGDAWTRVGRTRAPRVKHLPDEYRCPITLNAMVDPCLAPDGHSYERRAIERWFAAHGTSPLTNQRLESTEVVPNHALRKAIARFRDECDAAAASVGPPEALKTESE